MCRLVYTIIRSHQEYPHISRFCVTVKALDWAWTTCFWVQRQTGEFIKLHCALPPLPFATHPSRVGRKEFLSPTAKTTTTIFFYTDNSPKCSRACVLAYSLLYRVAWRTSKNNTSSTTTERLLLINIARAEQEPVAFTHQQTNTPAAAPPTFVAKFEPFS